METMTKEQRIFHKRRIDSVLGSVGVVNTLSIMASCLRPRRVPSGHHHPYEDRLHTILTGHMATCLKARANCKKRIDDFNEENKKC
jgi:hypothetical protein